MNERGSNRTAEPSAARERIATLATALSALAPFAIGLLLSALLPWLVTASAWASGMRPEAAAITLVVCAVAVAAGAIAAKASATFHRHAPYGLAAALTFASLIALPLSADTLSDAPAATASALSLALLIAKQAALPVAALGSALALLGTLDRARTMRWLATGTVVMPLLYPSWIDAGWALDTQARLWFTGFALTAGLVIGAVVLEARSDPVSTSIGNASSRTAILQVATTAAILPPLLTDTATLLLPHALPVSITLLAAIVAAATASRAEAHRNSDAAIPPISLIALVTLVLVACAMPATSSYRASVAAAAMILAVHRVAQALETIEPEVLAGGVALGATAGLGLSLTPLPWSPLSMTLLAALAASPGVVPVESGSRTVRRLTAFALLAIAASMIIATAIDAGGAAARWIIAAIALFLAAILAHYTRFWPERGAFYLMAAVAMAPLLPSSWKTVQTAATAWSPLRLIDRSDGSERRLLQGMARIASEPTKRNEAVDKMFAAVRQLKQAEVGEDTPAPLLVGMIGSLSEGTCATQRGDVVRVFEPDKAIATQATGSRGIARPQRCAPTARIVPGDLRRTLPREPDEAFDVIVMETGAFATPPLHLLTSDQLAVLTAKLAPTGIIAFDIRHDRLDVSRWLTRSISTMSGIQAATVGHELVVLTKSAALAEAIAASPDTNGLERLEPPQRPHHVDLVEALAARWSSRR